MHYVIGKLKNITTQMTLLCAIALVSGCANTLHVDKNRGVAVKAMIAGQINDPQASAIVNPIGAQGMDGERAVADLKNLHRDNQPGKQARQIIKLKPLTYDIDTK